MFHFNSLNPQKWYITTNKLRKDAIKRLKKEFFILDIAVILMEIIYLQSVIYNSIQRKKMFIYNMSSA